MPQDEDNDDFSHLPTVDARSSREEKQKLWERLSGKSGKPPAETPRVEEAPAPRKTMTREEKQKLWEAYSKKPEPRAEEPPPPPPPVREERVREPLREAPAVPKKAAPRWVAEAFGEVDEKQARAGSPHSVAEVPEKQPPVLPKVEEKAEASVPLSSAEEKDRKDEKDSKVEKDNAKAEDEEDKEADGKHFKPDVPAHPELELPKDEESVRKRRLHALYEKIGGRGLMVSVAVHFVLLLIAAFIVVQATQEKAIDFLPGGSTKSMQDAAAEVQHAVQRKRIKSITRMPMKKVVSTSQFAAITLPEAPPDMFSMPDMSNMGKQMGGKGLGTGGRGNGFGMGVGSGAKLTFLGNTATGKHVVYVCDVSASMSAPGPMRDGKVITRFELMKQELVKSLSRMPVGTKYQVIYFSDFAWPHDGLNTRDLKAFEKYRWEITPDKTSGKIPSYQYKIADMLTLLGSRQIINDSDNPGGTNWGSGLLMALHGQPKPDIIFFMTDGNKTDAEGWVDVVTKYNGRFGPDKMARIYTTAMMVPDAATELNELATQNGGRFTIVMEDGTIVDSEGYFTKK